MAVGVSAGTDADGAGFGQAGDLAGNLGHDAFQNDGNSTGFIERQGVGDQTIYLFGRFAFLFVTALLSDALWQHADVAHERDARLNDGFDLRDESDATFELHGIGPGLHEPAGIFQRLLGRFVAVKGQVGNDWGAFDTAADGCGVVDHHLHRDAGGIGQAEHDHAKGIADQDQVHTGFIEQARGWVIIGG